MNRSGAKRIAVLSLFVLGSTFVVTLVLGWSWNRDLHLVAVGALASMVMFLPWLSPTYRLVSTWTPATASVVIGFLLHPIAMTSGYPDDEIVDFVFLRGRTPDYFVGGAIRLTFALGIIALTYHLARRVFQAPSRQLRTTWANSDVGARRVRNVGFVLIGVGVFALASLVQQTGGFDPDRLSAKRSLLVGTDIASANLQTFGYLRALAATSVIGVVMLLFAWRRNLTRLRFVVVLAGLGVAFAYPFYISNRADMIGIVGTVVAAIILLEIKTSWFRIAALLGIALLLVSVATVTRHTETSIEAVATASFTEAFVDPFMISRHFTDLSKTVHIIDASGDRLDHANGSSYLAWVVAPVPRSIWASKPLISSGKIIGTSVYGTDRTGVPPGALAEAYWNFGFGGVPLIALLLGAAMGYLDKRFTPTDADLLQSLLFSVAVFRFGDKALGQSFGEAIFNLWFTAATVLAITLVAGYGLRAEADSARREVDTVPLRPSRI